MSAKPTVFTWATSTSFAGGPLPGKPTKVYPSSGKAAEGFHPAELPPAQNFNALFGRLGLWTQYLSDGDLTGDHSITGAFDVTGNTALTGTLDVTGAVDLDSTLEVGGLLTANAATFSNQTLMTGVISPAALASGNTDDWAPTGFSDANIVRVTTDAAHSTLRGLAGGASGRRLVLVNIGLSAGNLVLAHDDIGSTAANRFYLPSAGSMTIRPYGSADIWYDGADSRWRVLSVNA